MKKAVLIAMMMALILNIALMGCGRNQTHNQDQMDSSLQGQTSANISDNEAAGEKSGIVIESGNIVSSKQKEQLLNEVDKELDAVFNEIDTLDDIADEDLALDE